ncbi:MAG: alkaline phosphatase family protein [Peptococcaceae bacterium]|nr:alkaline phosphatase family protein [Peptococcaceae bacterium]MBQ5707194.1 alkaline phosphatase family protein [Peptococcaceae bacterium]
MARSEKIFVLGIDGLDPRLTKKYVDMGIMPNIKKFIDAGAQREDLGLLGGHPTVTPTGWTTLSRGCNSNVHGITCFWRQNEGKIDEIAYNLDSRNCKAEAIWNVTAEAGKKTLVWHWPGSSWPPTSNNPNLSVVDGVVPGCVGAAAATLAEETMFKADENTEKITLVMGDAAAATKCVINDLDLDKLQPMDVNTFTFAEAASMSAGSVMKETLIMDEKSGLSASFDGSMPVSISSIKPATGWANAPEGAKEAVVLLSKGLLRRPVLLLKNEEGIYDHVAIYKSKKDEEPMAVMYPGKFVNDIVDDHIMPDGTKEEGVRCFKLMDIDPEGKSCRMYISRTMSTQGLRKVCQPESLYDQLLAGGCGYPRPQSNSGTHDPEIVVDVMIDVWRQAAEYQSKCLNYAMNELGYEMVFSHFHSVDLIEHNFIRFMSDKGHNVNSEETYDWFMQENYKVCDEYIGTFLHLLDEGWTVIITSDHAQVCPQHDQIAIGDMNGINVGIMKELGLTVLQKDENGNEIPKIDWDKTVAIASRSCNIYLNMKGRDEHGIIEPKDKYEWEEEIMTRLYGYKSPSTGKRVIALALRNKDAVLLGYGGPECGDICFWTAEGYNQDHTDSLSTTCGDADTSVSPIFIAAGPGLKKSFRTDRIIRQIDVAPTIAALAGVRMPAQAEGAPAYQIFEEELIYN